MDFYKKITKQRDVAGILNEKEYKCVSLQAITNEAVKEHNKERLKDLVEEINGHLTDLRQIKEDKDLKSKEKCEKLINQFEECLVKILNKKPLDNVLTILNEKLEELQHLSNLAMQESKIEELKKLVEKIERNLKVVKEMPEVKDAKNTENCEAFLKLVTNYEHLLKIINNHLSAKRRIVSEPISMEVFQTLAQGNTQEQDAAPTKPNKIGLNEVEEKLKLMRQKRLNRLSTFVDQQSKLSEERSRENSPKNSNKSLENLSNISESVEIETAIKSIQSPEIVKPSSFWPIAREKLAKTSQQKLFPKVDGNVVKRLDPKVQTSGFQGGSSKVAGSFKNATGQGEKAAITNEIPLTANTGNSLIKEWPKPGDQKSEKALKEQDILTPNRTSNGNKIENVESAGGSVGSSVRSSFGKGTLTRSFAERQIENAKMQAVSDKPKVPLKQSNSTKTTPPRTPTQIRKIFNSFNACVLGSNNIQKSIEDLPREFNSPFEQELKTVQLKSTGFDYKQEQSKENDDSWAVPKLGSFKHSDTAPVIPKRTQVVRSGDKTEFARSKVFGQNEFETFLEQKKVEPNDNLGKGILEKPASEYCDVIIKRPNENKTTKTSDTKRLSLDFDAAIVRQHAINDVNQQPTDLLITVKRDSNTIPNENDRYSFSTFRSSTGSLKIPNENSVENPLYGVMNADGKLLEIPIINATHETSKYYNSDKVFKELILNCNSLEDMLKTVSSKELRNTKYVNKAKELNALLKDITKSIETTLDIDDSKKENSTFARFFEDISNIENAVKSFKGLKRDPEYLFIDKQLAKYYVEIDQVRPQSPTDRTEKKGLTERLKMTNKELENKVTRNEEILKIILEEQVNILGEKYRII